MGRMPERESRTRFEKRGAAETPSLPRLPSRSKWNIGRILHITETAQRDMLQMREMTDGLNTYRGGMHSLNTPCKFKLIAMPVSLFLLITRSPLLMDIVVTSSLLSLQHHYGSESIHRNVKVDDAILWNHFDGCVVTLRVTFCE